MSYPLYRQMREKGRNLSKLSDDFRSATFSSFQNKPRVDTPRRLRIASLTTILFHPQYLSYWLMFRVLGQLVGGAVNLGLNVNNNEAGSLSINTYLVFIVLQCLGPLVAAFLSLPHQVQRKDGTPVLLNLNPSVKAELVAMYKILKTKKILLLLPLIWQGTFSESLIGTYAADNFTVRSRALGSLLSAIVAALSCYILGFFLDAQRWSINFRGKTAFITIYVLQLSWWAWAIYTMNKYHYLRPTLDFGQDEWSRGFAVYVMLQIGFNLMCEFFCERLLLLLVLCMVC